MTDLEKALEHIASQIKLYRETDILDGAQLVEILKQITATLYYLENERSKYHSKYQSIINIEVLQGKTVARADNKANVEVPELYLLRRVMDSAYEVVGAIRTNISWLKSEKNSI